MRLIRGMAATLAVGAALGAAASVANSVPLLLGEGGRARADRSAWSQTAEFASLILDSGWAWAAMGVAVGWLVSRGLRPVVRVLVGALAGGVALVDATIVYDAVPMPFPFHQGALAALVAPVGAALNMVVLPPPAESPVAELVMLTVWGAAATATVLVVACAVRARRCGDRDSGAVVAAGALDDNVGGVVSGS